MTSPQLVARDFERGASVEGNIPLSLVALTATGELVGTVSLDWEDLVNTAEEFEYQPWIISLFVEESHQKKGVGKYLLDYCQRLVSVHGFKKVYLLSYEHNWKWYSGMEWLIQQERNYLDHPIRLYYKLALPVLPVDDQSAL
mgnify:CR=1 FL=1